MTRSIGPTALSRQLGRPQHGQNAYAWLASSIERLISDGALAYDTKLPGERTLAQTLAISRTTVAHAYEVLRERGFASAVQGSGTRVRIPGGPVSGGAEPLVDISDAPGAHQAFASELHAIDLKTAAPIAVSGLSSAFAHALDQVGSYAQGGGYYHDGIPKLRELLAARYTRRGLTTSPEEILITTGATAAVAAAVSALMHRGERLLVETSGYPNTLAAARQRGLRLVPVPDGETDPTGRFYANSAGRAGARGALLVPDFHNPTGHLMPDTQRAAIAHAWDRHGIVGIVDETLLDTWMDEPVTAKPMAAFAKDSITVGSASKTIWGGLRVGWIRCPHKFLGAVKTARLSLDLGAPVLEQLVVVQLLGSPETDSFGGLDAQRRANLRRGRDELWRLITDGCPGWRARRASGGLSLWWQLPERNSSELVRRAKGRGLAMTRGAAFSPDGHGMEGRLRTPFAQDLETLRRAAQILIDVNADL